MRVRAHTPNARESRKGRLERSVQLSPLVEPLEWDSEVLGLRVARIQPERLEPSEASRLREELGEIEADLVYWVTDPAHDSTQRLARQLGGEPVDERVTYARELAGWNGPDPRGSEVFPFTGDVDSGGSEVDELLELGVESGVLSRFAVDPKIDATQLRAFYSAWMRNSLRRRVADEVYVTSTGQTISGVVTVKARDGVGSIGLIAVGASVRGRGVGTQLIEAALADASEHGLGRAEVVTQGRNALACRLYERCGYERTSVKWTYHIWRG